MEETASLPEPAVGVREAAWCQRRKRAAWQHYLPPLLFCEWTDLLGNLCLDHKGLIGLRNPWVGEAFAFLELGAAVSSAIDLRKSTEDVEAEEWCCAEELDLAEEVLSGLRIYWAFFKTQLLETDSGPGPNNLVEKKVLADPAPPSGPPKLPPSELLFLIILAKCYDDLSGC